MGTGLIRFGSLIRLFALDSMVLLLVFWIHPVAALEIVETATGRLQVVADDLAVSAAPMTLEIRRWWAPSAPRGVFGDGWRSDWEGRLLKLDTGYELEGSLIRWRFSPTGVAGRYASPVAGRLEVSTDGTAIRLTDDGMREFYDAEGRLLAREDRNGNRMVLRYGATGRVLGLEGPRNSYVRFAYDRQGRLVRVAGSNGRSTRYTYANGRLASVRREDGSTTRYTYDAARNLTGIGDSILGLTQYGYDAQGRVLSQRLDDGSEQRYAYTDEPRSVEVTDRSGRVTTYRWSADGRIQETFDALDRRTVIESDELGRLVKTTGPTGLDATLRYDTSGRLIATTTPGGETTRLSYVGDSALVAKIILADGTEQRFSYDDRGNLTEITVGPDTVARYAYYPDGLLRSKMELGAETRTFSYDPKGRVSAVTDALRRTTRYSYDRQGNKTREVSPLGTLTKRTYDSSNRLISETEPDGSVTRYEYDAQGRRTRVIDRFGVVTEYSYDERGHRATVGGPQVDSDPTRRAVTVIDPDGVSETLRFDVVDRLIEVSDSFGRTTAFEYDALDRLVRETRPGGQEIAYTYDAAGRVAAVQNSASAPLQLEWDQVGRLRAVTGPQEAKVGYQYDVLGRITAVSDALGNESRFAYGPTGDLSEVRTPSGNLARYDYDAEGQLIAIHHPRGGITRIAYDQAGNRTTIVERIGNATRYGYDRAGNLNFTTDQLGRTTKFSANANEIRTELPDGRTLLESFGADGQVVKVDDGNYPVTYAYDDLSRLTAVSYPKIGKSVRYEYDEDGAKSAVIASDGRRIGYRYDAIKRVSAIVLPGGGEIGLDSDHAGRISKVHYPNAVIGTWAYDANGELSSIQYRDAEGHTLAGWSYRYDAAGNPVAIKASDKSTRQYTYDVEGRLVAERSASDSVRYAYNADGDRVLRAYRTGSIEYSYAPSGLLQRSGNETFSHDATGSVTGRDGNAGKIRYQYDVLGRLIHAAGPKGAVTYSYAPSGERVARQGAQGLSLFLHDGWNLFEELDAQGQNQALYIHGPGIDWPLAMVRNGQIYFYHVDAIGSVALMTDATGAAAVRYRTDAFGRMLEVQGELDNPFVFAGRYFEPELGLYYFRARYYDPDLGRFLTPDPIPAGLEDPANLNRYAYARNAPTRFGDPLGLIDIPYHEYKEWGLLREFVNDMIQKRYEVLRKDTPYTKGLSRKAAFRQAARSFDTAFARGRRLMAEDPRIPYNVRKSVRWQLSPEGQSSPRVMPPKQGKPLTPGGPGQSSPVPTAWEQVKNGVKSGWERIRNKVGGGAGAATGGGGGTDTVALSGAGTPPTDTQAVRPGGRPGYGTQAVGQRPPRPNGFMRPPGVDNWGGGFSIEGGKPGPVRLNVNGVPYRYGPPSASSSAAAGGATWFGTGVSAVGGAGAAAAICYSQGGDASQCGGAAVLGGSIGVAAYYGIPAAAAGLTTLGYTTLAAGVVGGAAVVGIAGGAYVLHQVATGGATRFGTYWGSSGQVVAPPVSGEQLDPQVALIELGDVREQLAALTVLRQKIEANNAAYIKAEASFTLTEQEAERKVKGQTGLQGLMLQVARGGEGGKGVGQACEELPQHFDNFKAFAEAFRDEGTQASKAFREAADWPQGRSTLVRGLTHLRNIHDNLDQYQEIMREFSRTLKGIANMSDAVNQAKKFNAELKTDVKTLQTAVKQMRAQAGSNAYLIKSYSDQLAHVRKRLKVLYGTIPVQQQDELRLLVKTAQGLQPGAWVTTAEQKQEQKKSMEGLDTATTNIEYLRESYWEEIDTALDSCRAIPGGVENLVQWFKSLKNEAGGKASGAALAFAERIFKVKQDIQKREEILETIEENLPKLKEQTLKLKQAISKRELGLAQGSFTQSQAGKARQQLPKLKGELKNKEKVGEKAQKTQQDFEKSNENGNKEIDHMNQQGAVPATRVKTRITKINKLLDTEMGQLHLGGANVPGAGN